MTTEEKIRYVQAVLQKDFKRNMGEYKQAYIHVFNHPFTSTCSCQLPKIRTALQEWLAKNNVINTQ